MLLYPSLIPYLPFPQEEEFAMTSIKDTYATQISALAKDFSLCCAAAALFFWDDNHNKGLRVEATSIMREFVDNVSFGRGDIDSHKF